MGSGTKSGRATVSAGRNTVEQTEAGTPITVQSVTDALHGLSRTNGGQELSNEISRVSGIVDQVVPGTRIEVRNSTARSGADYYEKGQDGGWVYSHVDNSGALTRQSNLGDARQVVTNIYGSGATGNRGRIRIVNAR